MDGTRIARVLRRIAYAIEGMSESELDDFIHELRGGKPKKRGLGPPKPNKARQEELEVVVAQLQGLSTREEGLALLKQLNWTRDELTSLARRMHVHVTKDDNIGRIKDKLVETAIGSRLSSAAIRGKE